MTDRVSHLRYLTTCDQLRFSEAESTRVAKSEALTGIGN